MYLVSLVLTLPMLELVEVLLPWVGEALALLVLLVVAEMVVG